MCDPDNGPDDKQTAARYAFACRARELELDLFWKRALFFWGFIGAAFVAFAAVRENLRLSMVVASFGFVCSVVWTLANRGSKFWYESWEQKLARSERAVTGPWFAVAEQPKDDLAWLKARRFSVSKLAIALSDYTAVLWLVLLASRASLVFEALTATETMRNCAALAFAAGSVVFALSLFILAKSKA